LNAAFVITAYESKRAGFLIEDNTVKEACFFSEDSIVGNVYTAVVEKVIPSIGGAFVNVGADRPYYLSIEKDEEVVFVRHGNKSEVRPQDVILVQVVREGMKTKPPAVTTNLSLTGDYAVVSLTGEVGISKSITDSEKRKELKENTEKLIRDIGENRKIGVILRTAANNASWEQIRSEILSLYEKLMSVIEAGKNSVPKKMIYHNAPDPVKQAAVLAKKAKYENLQIVTDEYDTYDRLMRERNAFPEGVDITHYDLEKLGVPILSTYNIQRAMTHALGKRVYLKSGGSLIIETTEALSVIDVNSGKSIHGASRENNLFKTNMEAVEEIATQLRLRNLSGIIIIDFINMKDKGHNDDMLKALKNVLAKDPVKTAFVDITALGLVEITRKKENKPLHEILKKTVDISDSVW